MNRVEDMTMQSALIDPGTADFYRRYAEHGAIQAEAAQSAISQYFEHAFRSGDKALDVGAGSGRDLAVLVQKGFDAFGIEPNDSMRAFASQNHPELASRLQSGSLPIIGTPFGGEFDGVLCSAVMMHVPDEQILETWKSIRRVLKPNGRVLISLPSMRPDLLDDDRDKDGRLFKNHCPAFINSLLRPLGFSEIRLDDEVSSEHSGVVWSIFLFEHHRA